MRTAQERPRFGIFEYQDLVLRSSTVATSGLDDLEDVGYRTTMST